MEKKKGKIGENMGHQINHYTTKVTNEKNLKKWIDQITECAFDPLETCSYHGNLAIHRDKTYKNYSEALDAIKSYDNGWYDDHIVKYYAPTDKARENCDSWNKKRDSYIKSHSIHNRKSSFIGCSKCGSKLNLGLVRGEKCPLCDTDLRAYSTIEKIKWFDTKAEEALRKGKEEYWLAKIEYHC